MASDETAMKFVLLYGPPAAGKLTVAQILAQKTGLLLVHNHMIVDFVEPLFPRGTLGYLRLIRKVRLATLEETAVSNYPGIIFTMVFAPSRQGIVDLYCDFVEELGGEACLVQITCDKAVMLERVADDSRRQWNKIHSPDHLLEMLATLEDPFQLVAGRSSLIIDSGKTDPEMAATKIIQHYDLREVA